MAIKGHQAFTLVMIMGIGAYTGVRFFEPLVIDQLRKDGNLRSDINIPQYDEEGNAILQGRTDEKWQDIRDSQIDNSKPTTTSTTVEENQK